ncbi:MAG: fused MFS/spermidine synthase [Rhodospirillaceae bacterium]|nr:fused MFS/spermidine synthase [Rhodospirillaceae bacterium]MBT7266570.1 fused MFS/spermidine synthase [Rhodospirillaceae bacterium]
MKKYEILIFVTGAITLALEVLASRIMTPYFGVSLYIWSGILSITLTFLAVGYRWGGHLSAKLSSEKLETLILAMPVASAAAIGLAAIIYPFAFPALSQINLILGSFVGATLFLALPLIALSAMNPLLIGLQRAYSNEGDSGAGRIFFISTVGSVAGVLLTAFVFIPNITNFRAILLLGLLLCVASLILVGLAPTQTASHKRNLVIASLVIALATAGLSFAKENYLRILNSYSAHRDIFRVVAEYTSMFGNIKVAEVTRRDGTGGTEKFFLQDGLIQNRTDLKNNSLSMYTYVLEAFARSFEPEAKDALVLGLGAGAVPLNLKRKNLNVSVVEINHSALQAATEHFGFDATGINIHLEDARTFVRRCRHSFDVAVVDLFLGDNIPDYLLTQEFFSDLKRCIRPGGSVVMNAFFDDNNGDNNKRLLATIGASFPKLYLAGIDGGNIFVVGTAGETPKNLYVPTSRIPRKVADLVRHAISQTRRIAPEIYADSKPVSDDHNIFSVLYADANMIERQYLAKSVPADLLVN